MFKKVVPYLLAAVVFLFVLAFLRPPAQMPVVTAALDLPAGHTLTEGDLTLRSLPAEALPAEGVITDPAQAVGQTLRVDRTAGDVILSSHLGESQVALKADERAVAVHVTDASGMGGVLRPGDLVGVSAVIFKQGMGEESGVFSKTTVEGLRVLYVQPSFVAEDPAQSAVITPDPKTGLAIQRQRSKEGVVILAVPVQAQAVVYDFQTAGIQATNAVRLVNAVELLTALDQADNARLSLYMLPKDAREMTTSGLWLPELVIRQVTPTPTGTPVPLAGQP